jgi:transposase
MTLYCAIDLHSDNNVVVVIDDTDHILFRKRLANDLDTVVKHLAPFREELRAVAVESTFNWYWLVDGLAEAGFRMQLVNPCAVQQYRGLKQTNDESDAFWLAHLMRLGLLPLGYIYPKAERGVRDLLRKRLQLVRCRVTHMLSAQNQLWRSTGHKVESKRIKQADSALSQLVTDPNIRRAIQANLTVIATLNTEIAEIEAAVETQMCARPEFRSLLTIHGIGDILGLTIALETGDIRRFPTVGQFASYCRCVKSERISNGKQKGVNNRKNGNAYLAWAFTEAAHSIIRHHKAAHRFYQRKRAQKNGALATKALAHKLARAAYYVMRDGVAFDDRRLFG